MSRIVRSELERSARSREELDALGRAAEIERAAREKGEREGRERAAVDAAVELTRWAKAHEAAIAGLQRQVVPLAIDIAGRVVEHEVTAAPERILDIAAAAVARTSRARVVTLVLHPDDAATLREHDPIALLASRTGGAIERCNIEQDASFARGDCVVRSSIGEVDARVATKLDAFARALAAADRR